MGSVGLAAAVIFLAIGVQTPAAVTSVPADISEPALPETITPAPFTPGPVGLPAGSEPRVRHLPPEVKAIYLTSWSAATPSRLREAIDLIKTTDLNGIVIDIKDYTGKVTFTTGSAFIREIGSEDPRLGDLSELVARLHEAGIYVIVRIAAFQDQHLVKTRSDLAVKDPQGRIWRDRRGLGWVDPASPEVWEYIVEVARAAADAGVDELNFDYIRFPTDGRLSALRYPFFKEGSESRRDVIQRFFEALTTALRPTGKHLSADLFGLTTVRHDDLGIGQVLEDALLYFDVVSPMVYPSHYARGFLGYQNPASHPYDVVHYSLARATSRRGQMARSLAMLDAGGEAGSIAQIRPWLQAFDLGAPYPPQVIRRQMEAVRDAGLRHGWYLWSPSNRYRPANFERE